MEYYLEIKNKKNELSDLVKTYMNFKCILLSEKSHSEKVTYYMISFILHSEKSKTKEMVNK